MNVAVLGLGRMGQAFVGRLLQPMTVDTASASSGDRI